MRKVGGEVVDDAVSEKLLIGIAGQVLERQHNDREARRGRELVLGDGEAQQARGEPRMPDVSARRENRHHERGGDRRPTK